MKLTRPLAAILGLITILPAAYMVVYATLIGPRLASVGAPGGISSEIFIERFRFVFGVNAAMVAFTIAMLGYYARVILQSRAIPSDRKPTWLVLLLVGNIISMPVVWYRAIWRQGR